jgi:replicative DNA helicase
MALLGSVMLRAEALYEVMDNIAAECFYAEKHGIIWNCYLSLLTRRAPIDILSVSSHIKESGDLEKIGGASYLTELVNCVPSAANVQYYAELVKKKHIMRELIRASEEISSIGFDEGHEIDQALDIAEKKIFDISHKGSKFTATSIKDALSGALERIDRLHQNTDELRGVPSGFAELDAKLSGFQKSDLIILAARPSVGKTSLVLDMARNAAIRHGIHTAIFSLEMSAQQLVDRMLAAESRVDAWKLRTGKLTNDEDFERIRDSLETLSAAPIYIDDQPAASILRMRSTARRLKAEKGLGLIIVDYLQLMAPSTTSSKDNVVQQVTEISRSLKQLAREMDVPVIALSQLSRAVEQRGGRPRLSDLRDSGSIEQDADVVMFIHREDKTKEDSGKPNIAEILIEKHRNGPTGKVELFFDDKKSSFLSIDKTFGAAISGGDDF